MTLARALSLVVLMAAAFIFTEPSDARELLRKEGEDGAELYSFELKSSVKLAALASTPCFDSDPLVSDFSANALLRLRIEPSFEADAWRIVAAYDNQLYWTSDLQRSASFALPLSTSIPFRFWQLAYRADSGSFVDLQQLDRAFVSFKTEIY